MMTHIEVLEARRAYLAKRLEAPVHHTDVLFLDAWLAEKAALDWALGKLEPDVERVVHPIGTTGHYGPIRKGETVQALVDVEYVGIVKGEHGILTHFDDWAGEEYPYIADFEGGRSAAFERGDLRRVD